MGAFVISKRFNGQFKFVFTSRKGKTIFTSAGFENYSDCEENIQKIKDHVLLVKFARYKVASGKFYFKMMLGSEIVAVSRKYSTELRMKKGIDEIVQYAAISEVLDFSNDDMIFQEVV